MQKWIFTQIALIAVALSVNAQATFKNIVFLSPGVPFYAKELYNGDFDLWYSSLYLKIDYVGDTLLSGFLNSGDGYGFYTPSTINYRNQGFLITGAPADTCSGAYSQSPVIAFVDTLYHLLWNKTYKFPAKCWAVSNQVAIDNKGNILLAGGTWNSCNFCTDKPLFLKTDSLGNVVWAKNYQTPQVGSSQFAGETLDGNYLLGMNLDSIGIILMKTDTSGSTLWTKKYNIPSARIYEYLEDPDSTLVIYGDTYSSGDSNNYNAFFIARLTKDGNVMWGKSYRNSAPTGFSNSQIIHTSDGNYAIVTQIQYSSNINTLLMKMNYNGEVLFAVSHGDNTHDEYGSGITETRDHGFIFGGQVFGYYPGNASNYSGQFIKSDSTGHAGCEEFNESIIVQPYFLTDSNLVAFSSIDGAVAYNGLVYDTSYGSFGVNNQCLFTDVSRPLSMTSLKLKTMVYPNPSSGKVTVKTNQVIKNTVVSYLIVYDAMGRIILQKAINKEEDKQLDLTKQGKGIYLIEITDGVSTSTNKVVVE